MGYDLYEYANRQGTGTLTAISPPNACSFKSAQEAANWPRLQIIDRWTCLWGPGPDVRVSDRTASASGSEIIVQEQRNASGIIVKYRVIARATSGRVSINQGDGTTEASISQGYYCDLILNSDGTVASITRPALFDNASTPGSVGLYDTVDAAKAEAGV